MKFPDYVVKNLTAFLSELPVEKDSEEWIAVQVGIAMINFPSSFKKGLHVFLTSEFFASEEGAFERRVMSIKIYPHKLQIRRSYSYYNSPCNINTNRTYRYIYPEDKYNKWDYDEVMGDLGQLFCNRSNYHYSDCQGNITHRTNFEIKTNLK